MIHVTLSTNPAREQERVGHVVLPVEDTSRSRHVDTSPPWESWATVELRLTVEQAEELRRRLEDSIRFAQID